MAEKQSDILKFQDKNNDGNHDDCPEVEFKEVKECPTCKPDPNAFLENWKKKINGAAWFNEKYCTFQVTIVAAEKSLLPEGLGEEYSESDLEQLADDRTEELFKKYEVEAAIALLEEFDKLNNEVTRNTIQAALEHSKYDLSTRAHSHVKLLYTVPYTVLEPIELAPPDADDKEATDPNGITVQYVATEIAPMLNRFRKAMHLYSRYYRVFNALGSSTLVFNAAPKKGKVFTVNQFDKYGDGLSGRNSIMYEMLLDLDSWLNSKQMNIVGFGGTKKGASGVTELEFTFTSEYKLDKLTVWTAGCGEPINYSAKNSLKTLNSRPSWKDATGCAYFSRLKSMDQDLRARVAVPWQEFIIKHTWPKLVEKTNYGQQTAGASKKGPNTALGCVGESLADEGKQLGQDILDDVFSIGDAIASTFNKNMCKVNRDEVLEENVKLGLVWDPETKTHRNVGAMAKEMAFKQLYKDEQIFTRLCAQMLEGKLNTSSVMQKIMPGNPAAKMDAMWKPLETIKNCGMFDLLLSAVKCLFKGFSLEEALKSMINSALKNMDTENFGNFFVGLPPDKQAEVVEKVKIALAKAKSPGTGKLIPGKELDAAFFGKINIVPPWEDKKVIEAERRKKGLAPDKQTRTLPEPEYEENQMRGSELLEEESGTPAQKSTGSSDDGPFKITEISALYLAPEIIIQAYATALLEVYSENYLELIDQLNDLPGAPIVASVIAMIDCPHPPLFKPSMMDFIKSIELPFCRDINDLTLPGLNNPFDWFPDLWDLVKLIFEIAKMVIMQTILAIIMKLIIKLCQLIGDAICKALEVAGQAVAALATGGDVMGAIKDALCGDDADEKKVEATANEIFEKLGVGGAALSNTDAVKGFLGDLSSAITPRELTEALSGQPSEAFLEVSDSLVEYEYPEFRDGFANKSDLADFFSSLGNLFPADVRSAMQDMLNTTPAVDDVPANPSLCASPQAKNDFKELRCELLANRATATQCRDMFDNIQAENLEDLGDLGDILQTGFPKMLEDALPPLISTPGCDDGLIPFESEDSIKVTSTVISDSLKGLKISYAKDMIGQGGFLTGDASWGMVNMILSDTSGTPLSKHQQNAYSKIRVVDFAETISPPIGVDGVMDILMGKSPPPTSMQQGMYPSYVAEWLQQEMISVSTDLNFVSNNKYKESQAFYRSFEALGFESATSLFKSTGSRVNLLKMPDYGYNVVFGVDLEAEKLKITRLGRKDDPEVTLSFYNGRKGRVQAGAPWGWGFNLNLYLSEMRDQGSTPYNVFADTARISIVDQVNLGASKGKVTPIKRRKYEFVSVDDTLDKYDTSEYPNFQKAFETKQSYLPQVVLLKDMIAENNPTSPVEISNIKRFYDDTMNGFMSSIINEVINNGNGWEYGARYDDLTEKDIEYVVKPGQTDSPAGTLYSNATVGGKPIDSDMSILGYSRMEFEEENNSGRPNRVIYLNPIEHGGSYVLPAIYIKPMENKGWLGLVNMMFPELNGCKPFRTDLVDFADISEEVQNSYSSIPEDERLQFGDCAIEVPYNRILVRPSKAGIQGVITAACRIYASAHFIKSMATFTTFAPKFPETYSSLYATYVIENMEEAFKDAQNDRREWNNSFKDYEFWYSFLEQTVQTYGRRVSMGEITAPANALRAMKKINDMQEGYYTRSRNDLSKDKFENEESNSQTYKNYKMKYNLMAIQRTEEYAKLVLKEIVMGELNKMGEVFVSNFKMANITPKYTDIEDYSLMKFTTGGEALTISSKVIPRTRDLPTEGTAHYTNGGELSTQPAGEDYVGYYHVQEDEDGNKAYMEGEYHSTTAHGELTVYAKEMIIPVGDVADYGSLVDSASGKPMQIEKYIKIDGIKYNTETAYEKISANKTAITIYDAYPGTMKKVMETDSEGNEMVVGIKGEIGVRYGLEYSIQIQGATYKLTSVEVDALDLPLSKFRKLNADSSQLYCLLNLLKKDEKFQLVNKYIFALNKLTATTAIYNDYGFLPSIGEYTVSKGMDISSNILDKPGIGVNLNEEGALESYTFTKGWEYGTDRTPSFWTWGTLEFDDWDQVILRKSRAKIKRIFKNYYNVRKTRPGDSLENDPSKAYVNNLLSSMFKPAGLSQLKWFQKGLLRPNPYNSKGKLCKK